MYMYIITGERVVCLPVVMKASEICLMAEMFGLASGLISACGSRYVEILWLGFRLLKFWKGLGLLLYLVFTQFEVAFSLLNISFTHLFLYLSLLGVTVVNYYWAVDTIYTYRVQPYETYKVSSEQSKFQLVTTSIYPSYEIFTYTCCFVENV